jgi:hypothetical protein
MDRCWPQAAMPTRHRRWTGSAAIPMNNWRFTSTPIWPSTSTARRSCYRRGSVSVPLCSSNRLRAARLSPVDRASVGCTPTTRLAWSISSHRYRGSIRSATSSISGVNPSPLPRSVRHRDPSPPPSTGTLSPGIHGVFRWTPTTSSSWTSDPLFRRHSPTPSRPACRGHHLGAVAAGSRPPLVRAQSGGALNR